MQPTEKRDFSTIKDFHILQVRSCLRITNLRLYCSNSCSMDDECEFSFPCLSFLSFIPCVSPMFGPNIIANFFILSLSLIQSCEGMLVQKSGGKKIEGNSIFYNLILKTCGTYTYLHGMILFYRKCKSKMLTSAGFSHSGHFFVR